jgi:hypothetical protein
MKTSKNKQKDPDDPEPPHEKYTQMNIPLTSAQPKYRNYLIIQQNEGPVRVRLMELCCAYTFVTE